MLAITLWGCDRYWILHGSWRVAPVPVHDARDAPSAATLTFELSHVRSQVWLGQHMSREAVTWVCRPGVGSSRAILQVCQRGVAGTPPGAQQRTFVLPRLLLASELQATPLLRVLT